MRGARALRALGMLLLLARPTAAASAAAPPPPPAEAMDPRHQLERLRALYLAAVRDGRAIEQAEAEIQALRARLAPPPASWLDAALTAYGGALTTLRAKHSVWPPTRLRHLRRGLAALDQVVARHPEHVEARYLRLMSCYFLPSVLGRSGSVREDFEALAALLPRARTAYPAELYGDMVRFVMERADLDERERQTLESVLAPEDE